MPKKTRSEGCEVDMTPMIDVVFQLIIFFIVTIQMEKNYKEDIELEDAKFGPEITSKQNPRTLVVEVDRKGRISMQAVNLSRQQFRSILVNRFKNYGVFPVLIRGDKRTKHSDIRWVMDTCAATGLWKINFVAIKEHKSDN